MIYLRPPTSPVFARRGCERNKRRLPLAVFDAAQLFRNGTQTRDAWLSLGSLNLLSVMLFALHRAPSDDSEKRGKDFGFVRRPAAEGIHGWGKDPHVPL